MDADGLPPPDTVNVTLLWRRLSVGYGWTRYDTVGTVHPRAGIVNVPNVVIGIDGTYRLEAVLRTSRGHDYIHAPEFTVVRPSGPP